MNDSDLNSKSETFPGITANLNPLCAETKSQYSFVVLLGVRKMGEESCTYVCVENKTEQFGKERNVFIPLGVDKVNTPVSPVTDYEYCAKLSLRDRNLLSCKFVNKTTV